jgi:hypothetical protein
MKKQLKTKTNTFYHLINKKITIKRLAEVCAADKEKVKQWTGLFDLERDLCAESYASGRANYIKIQHAICEFSNGWLEYGGQGNEKPDFYYGLQKSWGETKAYHKDKRYVDVAASSFFASNAKAPKHKALLKENSEEAKRFLFEHSYDKNEVYCLTSTSKLKMSFDEIELIFVDRDTLISCLKPDDLRKVDMQKLMQKVEAYE